jgi:hypothetical protein
VPTFSRNGKESWVAAHGEDRIAILDTARAVQECGGVAAGAVLFQASRALLG